MCLYIQSGPHVAERNIPVYKAMSLSNTSPIRNFFYEPNTLYPSVNLELVALYNGVVYEGYHGWSYQHTYVKKETPTLWVRTTDGDKFTGWRFSETKEKLVAFTIPKGATYYIGRDGDIVASQIKSGSLKPLRARDINRRNRNVP